MKFLKSQRREKAVVGESYAENYAEGVTLGRIQVQKSLAKRMWKKGMSVEEIAKILELAEGKVVNLLDYPEIEHNV